MNRFRSSILDPEGLRTDRAARDRARVKTAHIGPEHTNAERITRKIQHTPPRKLRSLAQPPQRLLRALFTRGQRVKARITQIYASFRLPQRSSAQWAELQLSEIPRPTVAATKALRNRALVVGTVLAVPALAAPGDFGALAGSARGEETYIDQGKQSAPMGFERPGMSFPGSAFYFLADPPSQALIALPNADARSSGAEIAGYGLGDAIDAGPAARPFFSPAGSDYLRAKQCLAQAIWYEAANESEAGQRAVAQVVLNRVAHASWPASVCAVVYQGSERHTGCQFSFTCDGSLAREARGSAWDRARDIAGEALSGSVYAPIGHATHYHTLWVDPYWAEDLDHIGTIGAHLFYRNRGAGGERSAFTGTYDGIEPLVADLHYGIVDEAVVHVAAANDGVTEQITSEPASALTSARSNSAAIPVAPAYSGAGRVREDYSRAGEWKNPAARAEMEAESVQIAREHADRIDQPSQH